MRKYGIDNFEFSIIEVVADEEDLYEREIYWINYYNTFHKGYNEDSGGLGVHDCKGEKHHNHKLTTEDVIDIRTRWSKCEESVCDIFKDYKNKINKTEFKKIYTWQT